MPITQESPAEKPRLNLLGGDPEVFVKEKSSGKLTASCGRIGGHKGAGLPFGPKKNHYGWKVLEDNVAVEFNFNAVIDQYHWTDCIQGMIAYFEDWAGQKGLSTVPVSWHKFNNSDLMAPGATVFGCDPDYDAYDITDSKRILDPSLMGNYRFCGGHLHLGYNNPNKVPASAVAILCDMFIGLPSVTYDTQGPRRGYYGKAGLYRPKPYGLEYRTMSNWWLRQEHASASSCMAREAFTIMAYIDTNIDELSTLFDRMPLRDIKVAIDSENKRTCKEVWSQAASYAVDLGLMLGQNFYPRH